MRGLLDSARPRLASPTPPLVTPMKPMLTSKPAPRFGAVRPAAALARPLVKRRLTHA